MSEINVLLPHVADLIAAGEVVERPASVVKELIENSFDAGAKRITVELRGGGCTLIRVRDDGKGMHPEDAAVAFLRHATSKLSDAAGLERIGTMGFRGEALAAIAAVSRIELLTRRRGEDTGVRVTLEAGDIQELGPAGCAEGTVMTVRDLFFNTPARRKFLKSDRAEAAACVSAALRAAMGRPEVSVRCVRDGEEVFFTAGDGRLDSVALSLLGRDVAAGLLPCRCSGSGVQVEGLVSAPHAACGNRTRQYFFVNGRPIRSLCLQAALEQAYHNRLMSGRFPACILHITLSPAAVDVNVHPAKTEVKFAAEKAVFDVVYGAVTGALSAPEQPARRQPSDAPQQAPAAEPAARPAPRADAFSRMTSAQFRASGGSRPSRPGQSTRFAPETAPRPDAKPAVPAPPRFDPAPERPLPVDAPASPRFDPAPERPLPDDAPASPRFDPAPERSLSDDAPASPRFDPAPERPLPIDAPASPRFDPAPERPLSDDAPAAPVSPRFDPAAARNAPRTEQPPVTQQTIAAAAPETAPPRVLGELMGAYIVAEWGTQLLLIDKHAAHERLLFDRLRTGGHAIMAQQLLEPVILSGPDAVLLLEHAPLMEALGMELEPFGVDTLAARTLPSDTDPGDGRALLEECAAALRRGASPELRQDALLRTVACKAAVKAGRSSDAAELQRLTEAVAAGRVRFCPHGRPVSMVLTKQELDKRFKRIV